MKQYRLAFYTTEKERSKSWGAIIAKGAREHGDVVDLIPTHQFMEGTSIEYDGGGIIGLSRATGRIMPAHLAAGKHFLFFDKGYFGRGMYWRVSVDAWQPLAYFQRFVRPMDRLDELAITIKEERVEVGPDAPIVLAGACQNYSNFFNLGNVNDFNLDVLLKLKANTKRPLIYRPNPSWFKKHFDEFRPIHHERKGIKLSIHGQFTDVLRNCHLLVTHGTSAAVAALQNGVPSLVIGDGIARPLSMGPNWENIEEPFWPNNKVRWQFFADLAYCQWTIPEYASGKAWQEIRYILSTLDTIKSEPDATDTLNQYKLMHESPKYFRGLNTLNYRRPIGELVQKTGSCTVLDFGSGKGQQYEDPYYLHTCWDINTVRCYDPGVPQFSKLPTEKFDGVICCDVMEHVPEQTVDETLKTIFSLANKFVFFVITTTLAKKNLPDGNNCHLTIKPESWWLERIMANGGSNPALHVELITKGEADD